MSSHILYLVKHYLEIDGIMFFVGKDFRDRFKIVLSNNAKIFEWSEKPFAVIKEDMYEYKVYFTDSGEADSGKMKIGTQKHKIIDIVKNLEELEKLEGDYIYIRPVAKNKIEWQVVSNKNDLRTKDDIKEECCILLD